MTPIISPNVRIRHPEHFEVGAHSIVDDFSYFSARVRIGLCSHIASGCSVAGGDAYLFTLGDFCSLSSGVKIWCSSDDFVNDIVTIIPPGAGDVKQHVIAGDVSFADCTAVGSNSVVMPNNHIPEGTVIGAVSFVPAAFAFEAWSVYAGAPIRLVGRRNREAVTAQARALRDRLQQLRTP
jgi:acetyltransferase-like isoleucine patch superfamily enzyme